MWFPGVIYLLMMKKLYLFREKIMQGDPFLSFIEDINSITSRQTPSRCVERDPSCLIIPISPRLVLCGKVVQLYVSISNYLSNYLSFFLILHYFPVPSLLFLFSFSFSLFTIFMSLLFPSLPHSTVCTLWDLLVKEVGRMLR